MSADGPNWACCGWSLHVGHSPDCKRVDDDTERGWIASHRYWIDRREGWPFNEFSRFIAILDSRDATLRTEKEEAEHYADMVRKLDQAVAEKDAALCEAREEITKLKLERKEGFNLAQVQAQARGKLLEECERLRAALTPFAELLGCWTGNGYDESPDDEVVRSVGTIGRDYAFITVRDLRRARDALARPQPATPSLVPPPVQSAMERARPYAVAYLNSIQGHDDPEEHATKHFAVAMLAASPIQTPVPSPGATDGGQPEAARHLSESEQRVMKRALRASSRLIASGDGAKASAEDVELAREIYRRGKYHNDVIGEFAAALSARGAEGERAGIERAAQLCEQVPGDETLPPFPQSQVQLSKAVTAHFLARDIRALLPPAAPEK